MNDKAIEPIVKKTGKALSVPQEIIPLKKKMKRAKPLKYDTGEKIWPKHIDDILSGKKEKKEKSEKRESDDEIPF